jgi:hypothetical protein
VEFNSKGSRETGDVVFHLPERVKIFLSWGELEKVRKRFNSAQEHAEYNLNAMKKGKHVTNFEQTSQDYVTVNTHNAALNKVKFDETISTLPFTGKKTLQREAFSLHVHCSDSNRYFVLYTMTPSDTEGKYDKTMTKMMDSFRCH